MVLFEHLPLIGLALGFAHHHSGRASHSHPALPNHKHVPQISADMSPFDQTPKLIAARAAEDSHETPIPVSPHHLETILERIRALEEEISNMILFKTDSSIESTSKPSTPSKPETLVVTTHETTAAPAIATVGGVFMEDPADLDAPEMSTTIVTLTTLITHTLTMMPTSIVTLTAFPTFFAEASPISTVGRTIEAETYQQSKSKALIPFFNVLASAHPPEATTSSDSHSPDVEPLGSLLSTDVIAEEKRPEVTPLGPGFNATATYHRVSLSAASSGFMTVRRGT
ncbi:hypothetical protein MKX07_002226 [Trichoderma sp. CBMAI-0711]|uniref:Uncharacterized protein n=1 Tax=Trichoderma parareesei TaxID=858221 RepID=A0A2H2ZSS0_TRIPA|nr:hypothetical protein MKX07_002226 [Trichoderma sp. CBMAI-0711]OTA06190.1 hypothetical protein A9Z42_0069230 [Trichoderma parareesei]